MNTHPRSVHLNNTPYIIPASRYPFMFDATNPRLV
jgi:hypothetical protein